MIVGIINAMPQNGCTKLQKKDHRRPTSPVLGKGQDTELPPSLLLQVERRDIGRQGSGSDFGQFA